MTEPFTPKHVSRFLVLCLLGIAVVVGIFYALTHASAHESITPANQSWLLAPGSLPRLAPLSA